MKRKALIVLAGLALLSFIYLGVHTIVNTKQNIQLKDIQIKDKSAELKGLELEYDRLNIDLEKTLQEKNVDKTKVDELQKERDQLRQRLEQTEKELQAKAEAKRVAAERQNKAVQALTGTQTAHAAPIAPIVSGDPVSIGRALNAAKFGDGQWDCLHRLWMKESGWSVSSYNKSSGATGIPQSLPGVKMASHGEDWRTNPTTQIQWGLDYIASRYGTPCSAWSHSQATNWY